jgi:hypothetical protein
MIELLDPNGAIPLPGMRDAPVSALSLAAASD